MYICTRDFLHKSRLFFYKVDFLEFVLERGMANNEGTNGFLPSLEKNPWFCLYLRNVQLLVVYGDNFDRVTVTLVCHSELPYSTGMISMPICLLSQSFVFTLILGRLQCKLMYILGNVR